MNAFVILFLLGVASAMGVSIGYAIGLDDGCLEYIGQLNYARDRETDLVGALRDNYGIVASYDGLRHFWTFELTDEALRLKERRDFLDDLVSGMRNSTDEEAKAHRIMLERLSRPIIGLDIFGEPSYHSTESVEEASNIILDAGTKRLEDENAKLRTLLEESLMDTREYAEKYGIDPSYDSVNEHLDSRLRELGIGG